MSDIGALQSITYLVVGTATSQSNAASSSAIKQTHHVLSASGVSANASSSASVLSWHAVGGSHSVQGNACSLVAVSSSSAVTGMTLSVEDLAAIEAIIVAQLLAIKTKTDQLTFTTGKVHSDVKDMNGAAVLGTGTSLDKWRGE